MAFLVVCLPSAQAGPSASYAYVVSPNGQQVQQQGSATAALLPALVRGSTLVAVIPSSCLSWHGVDLPDGLGAASPRLRSVLSGLLEDRLLDDIETLHLALAPQTGSAPNGQTWVAACDRPWLQGHLQALEAAQRPVARVVPEFSPDLEALQLHAVGDAESACWVMTGESVGGLMRLPFSTAALAVLPALPELAASPGVHEQLPPLVFAEPALAAHAEQFSQGKVSLVTRPQRWLDAARSPWDLAQFDLARTARSRALKKVSGAFGRLFSAPEWRPVRWGAAALLLVNLVGLNVWAWQQSASLAATRAAIQNTLTQTFPAVKVVIDAPVQMQRELTVLRQVSGAVSSSDLDAMLSAVGASAPPGRSVTSIDFSAGELRVKGLTDSPQEAANLPAELKAKGYAVVSDSDGYVVKTISQGAP